MNTIQILDVAVITLRELLSDLSEARPGDEHGREYVSGYVGAEFVVIDRLQEVIDQLRSVERAKGVLS